MKAMNDNALHTAWHDANRRYLTAALAVVRDHLERYAAHPDRAAALNGEVAATDAGREQAMRELLQDELRRAAEELPAPSALDALCGMFGLSEFERDVLLLCVGVELDASFADACRRAGGMPPTFSLALAALPAPHWSALTPNAPLRRWRLIDPGASDRLTASPLRVEEPILHYLVGVPGPDERIAALTEEVPLPPALTPSHSRLAGEIASLWTASSDRRERLPAIRMHGTDGSALRGVAAAVCAPLGMTLRAISVHALPAAPADLDMFCRLWEREAALHSFALLLDCSDPGPEEGQLLRTAARLADELHGALLIGGEKGVDPRSRPVVPVEVRKPSAEEQRALWNAFLPESDLREQVERVITQFDLSAGTIRLLSEGLLRTELDPLAGSDPDSADTEKGKGAKGEETMNGHDRSSILWNACRLNGRSRLEDLAQRIEPAAAWDDLILPERQKGLLREMVVQARNRGIVHGRWGFRTKGNRGLGISSLFAGPSGTGKTMAAEVLARELELDLYRIDLSAVVSKYIGETEKNLRRIFDAADEGGALLLFDEADSLFGKRSEVKDSHDRHANIEVSYLLQRMEAYRGLAVLTTNLKSALDVAFVRRIRFIVQFPFPDAESRAEIWRRVFPESAPTTGLDPDRLAQLNVTGGHIRNIALGGAFLAAEAGEPIGMKHLLAAAKTEMAKMEKNITAVESRGWV